MAVTRKYDYLSLIEIHRAVHLPGIAPWRITLSLAEWNHGCDRGKALYMSGVGGSRMKDMLLRYDGAVLRRQWFLYTSLNMWNLARFAHNCRVDRGLPWLQADVCFLRLPPGFPAVPPYLSHTFGCSPAPGRRGYRIGAPTPTERSVRISRTTLFRICLTAQLMISFSYRERKSLDAVTEIWFSKTETSPK